MVGLKNDICIADNLFKQVRSHLVDRYGADFVSSVDRVLIQIAIFQDLNTWATVANSAARELQVNLIHQYITWVPGVESARRVDLFDIDWTVQEFLCNETADYGVGVDKNGLPVDEELYRALKQRGAEKHINHELFHSIYNPKLTPSKSNYQLQVYNAIKQCLTKHWPTSFYTNKPGESELFKLTLNGIFDLAKSDPITEAQLHLFVYIMMNILFEQISKRECAAIVDDIVLVRNEVAGQEPKPSDLFMLQGFGLSMPASQSFNAVMNELDAQCYSVESKLNADNGGTYIKLWQYPNRSNTEHRIDINCDGELTLSMPFGEKKQRIQWQQLNSILE